MLAFIQNLLTLLVTPPGMLLYHLAIVVSIMAGLQAALLSRQDRQANTRLIRGLLFLLVAQVAIFAYGVVLWQQGSPPLTILPIIDRAVTLICLVWLIWMWAVPKADTPGDFAHGTLNLVVVLMVVSSLMIWSRMPAEIPFNANWLDWAWQGLSGAVALSGLVAISILRPRFWGVGAACMIIFILGSVAHILWKDPTSDLPALARLSQLLIYPMLPVLAFRQVTAAPTASVPIPPVPEETDRGLIIPPRALSSWLQVYGEKGEARAASVTRAISHTIPADLVFVVEPPDNEDVIALRSGYDLLQDETIPDVRILQDRLPGIIGAIMRGEPLMLSPENDGSDDQAALAEQLGMERSGSLLFIPNNTGASPVAGILLLSPYAQTHWSGEEQLFLMDALDLILPIIQDRGQNEPAEAALASALKEVETLKEQQAQLKERYEQGMELLEASAISDDQEQTGDLASLLLIQEEMQRNLAALRIENGRLQALLAAQPDGEFKMNFAHLEHELQASLAENASVKNLLVSANMKIMTLEMQLKQSADLGAFSEVLPGLISTVQELRQPMTSLRGHTELLLNDAAGELSPLQRQYLERIRAAVENLHNQLELVIRLASMQTSRVAVNPSHFCITDLVDEAIDATRSLLAEREIALEVKLSPQLPELKLDREAILQVLVELIRNAGGATPQQGEIRLAIEQATVLDEPVINIQVGDQGKVVPEKQRDRVFLGRYRADEALLEGLGDRGLGLFVVRSLVEAHGGSVSHTANNVGNTITVQLPLEAVLAGAVDIESESPQ